MAVIKDVARLAGVAPSTVSKYFNNPEALSEKYKEQIAAVVHKLNYVPSATARSMRTKLKNMVAVVVPDILTPYYMEAYNMLHVSFLSYGVTSILYSMDTSDHTVYTLFKNIASSPVDGVVLCSIDDIVTKELLMGANKKLPVVIMNCRSQNSLIDTVLLDIYAGIQQATCYFIEKGHKRIGFIGGPIKSSTFHEKETAYRNAIENSKLAFDKDLMITTEPSFYGGYTAAKQLMRLSEPPDAIVAANDVLAIGGIKYLSSNNFRIPQDVAVFGFDGIQLGSIFDPSVSTMAQPLESMCRAAADMLINRIKYPATKPKQKVFSTQMVIRRSTDQNAPIDLY